MKTNFRIWYGRSIRNHALLILPDDDDDKSSIEDGFAGELAKALTDQQTSLLEGIGISSGSPTALGPEIIKRAENLPSERVTEIARRRLLESASLGVDAVVKGMEGIGVSFNWHLANAQAREWAATYSFRLVGGINQTSRDLTAQAVTSWIREGTPLKTLESQLGIIYGAPRAMRIAVTEVTRAYANGSVKAYRESGVVKEIEWLTSNDAIVRECDICWPLHEKRGTLEHGVEGKFPPAHPNCRCRVAGVVGELPDVELPSDDTPSHLEDGFPTDLNRLEKVRDMGGSTGAIMVKDPVDGELYILKRGKNANHLRSEMATDRAYQALGVSVPDFHGYENPDGPVKLSRFIQGRTLADVRVNDPKLYAKAVKQLQKDFAADVYLGNWDVIGLGADNILVDKKGNPWRIDNGAGLLYRAQGELKQGWGKYPTEFWTLRNPRINPDAAGIYGDLKYDEIVKQMTALTKKQKDVIAALPEDLRGLMSNRMERIGYLARTGKTMLADQWNVGYVDEFSRHLVGIGQQGIIDNFPARLNNRRDGVIAYDENGEPFDRLRGKDSHVTAYAEYLKGQGGDINIINDWADEQAGSSWGIEPRAAKWFWANQRSASLDNYYWRNEQDQSLVYYQQSVQKYGKQFDETLTSWHAFNYALFSNTKIGTQNKDGAIRLIRTENKEIMEMYGIKRGKTGLITRGAIESTSVFRPVKVDGTELTIQYVPPHRIFGTYFMERPNKTSECLFYSDGENEIVAMLDGIEAKYQ